MSFTNCKIDILVNDKTYSIYYSYNDNTTFQDLLEYFSFLIPSLNICQCYNFQAFENKKNIDNNLIIISKCSKITDYQDYLKNLRIIKVQKNCLHIQSNNLINSKEKIISFFENKIREFCSNITYFNQPNYKNYDPLNFYDVIIDIDSIKSLIGKGWKIKMNSNGKENYNNFKNQNILKIGIIGNANKGKSFILSKLSKISFPFGTTIKTEGLSIKYPEKTHQNRKIVLLDSAGLETPVLINKELNDENEKDKDKEEDWKSELFKEKSREKLITELFLQNYIVNNSDILLIVVDSLSFSEQKLLMKIKREIEKSNRTLSLFIIHNLKTYT